MATLWTEEIAFYLDGASFKHKHNPADQARAPKGRIWRKSHEGLRIGCTAKGSHCGSGGRMVTFMVAISYREEGGVLCEKYTKMDGQYFKGLVALKENFRRRLRKRIRGVLNYGHRMVILVKIVHQHVLRQNQHWVPNRFQSLQEAQILIPSRIFPSSSKLLLKKRYET